jgi:hypothetical protein
VRGRASFIEHVMEAGIMEMCTCKEIRSDAGSWDIQEVLNGDQSFFG